MNRLGKWIASATLAAAAVGAAPRAAHADNDFQAGYVCLLRTNWSTAMMAPNNMGSDGYTVVSLYTGPNCTGTFVGTSWIMSTNASICPAPTQASPTAMQTAVSTLTQAKINGLPVEIDIFPSSYGTKICGAQVSLAAPAGVVVPE
jgi:hypothetical protein